MTNLRVRWYSRTRDTHQNHACLVYIGDQGPNSGYLKRAAFWPKSLSDEYYCNCIHSSTVLDYRTISTNAVSTSEVSPGSTTVEERFVDGSDSLSAAHVIVTDTAATHWEYITSGPTSLTSLRCRTTQIRGPEYLR